MDKPEKAFIIPMLRCPRCGATLRSAPGEERLYCKSDNGPCKGAAEGFPIVGGQAALVVFDDSVLDEASLVQGAGASSLPRRKSGGLVRAIRNVPRRVLQVLRGANSVAKGHCDRLIREVFKRSGEPIVLNVGGGDVGAAPRHCTETPASCERSASTFTHRPKPISSPTPTISLCPTPRSTACGFKRSWST